MEVRPGNIQSPPPESLPSARRLAAYAAAAAIGVAAIVVTLVLPAERAVDPTGLGRRIGLTQMGEVKLILEMNAADHEAEEEYARGNDSLALMAPADTAAPVIAEETRLTAAPGETVEIRLVMKRGARVAYSWATDSGTVSVAAFADSLGAPASRSRPRFVQVASRSAGELVAGFDGWHGLRWYNAAGRPIAISLRTSGHYLSGRQGIVDQR